MLQCYNLIFLKELISIGQINQKSVWFVIIGILKTLVINMSGMFVINGMIY